MQSLIPKQVMSNVHMAEVLSTGQKKLDPPFSLFEKRVLTTFPGGRVECHRVSGFSRMQGMLIFVDFVAACFHRQATNIFFDHRGHFLCLDVEYWPPPHRANDVTHNVIKGWPLQLPFAHLRGRFY